MSADGAFRVEDFLEAITSQLDRTQDALRLKAVNRPLTYAIKEFGLDLKVFVEMDRDAQVVFRSAGPDDVGASTVSIGFTTITRPMIEENTITLSEVQGPSLDQIGLNDGEQRNLERVGVRSVAQLRRLNMSSGEDAVARFANVPVNRIRAALQATRPSVDRLRPDDDASPDRDGRDGLARPSVRVPAGTRRLRLDGSNLRGDGQPTLARLNGMAVPVVEADHDHLTIDLENLNPQGRLEIDVAGGETLAFELSGDGSAPDPWSPA